MNSESLEKNWQPLQVERFSDFGSFLPADFPHYAGWNLLCFRPNAAEKLEPIWRKHAEMDLQMFRTTSYPQRVFLGESFVSTVAEMGLVGMRFKPVELS